MIFAKRQIKKNEQNIERKCSFKSVMLIKKDKKNLIKRNLSKALFSFFKKECTNIDMG